MSHLFPSHGQYGGFPGAMFPPGVCDGAKAIFERNVS